MINSVFTDTFNFLFSSLNSLNQNSSQSKNTRPSDALKRLLDTVQFIYTKKTTFNTDLKAVREESVQMKTEAQKLKNRYLHQSRRKSRLVSANFSAYHCRHFCLSKPKFSSVS